MGKVTGFLEYERVHEISEPPAERVLHWKEFIRRLDEAPAKQQAARCMDCGIPFCNNGCPVNNLIPDFNELVYQQDWKQALDVLHATNNFPEFTGRICPAPCEAACTLNINRDAVGIKSIEHAIIDYGWEQNWVVPQPPRLKTGKKVAVVGAGPAGLACAQQLARAGHEVTVFEKSDRIGGLLRYGIPDFKLDKALIDRRVEQLSKEGVVFKPSTFVGSEAEGEQYGLGLTVKTPEALQQEFDAVAMTGGAEQPRDLPIAGRELEGVYFAMDFLRQRNKINAGDSLDSPISVEGKHVVVIGGGDTGSDCVGSSNRLGAKSVTQIELMPQPPEQENKEMTWPYWPLRLRTSSSHEEGVERDWSISSTRFIGKKGKLTGLAAQRVKWERAENGQMTMTPLEDSDFDIPADVVFLAMGFVSPVQSVLDAFGVERDARGNARASTQHYQTNVEKVFAAGDMRRGQSLVVWAIREGRQCAAAIDQYLMGRTELPR